jgi:hypothetical protein
VNTLVPSLIRTYVPVVVGSLVAWLITLGVEVDESLQVGLITALTGLLIAVYYTVIRLVERKWPKLSVLLGTTQIPAVYAPTGEQAKNAPLAAPNPGT